MALPTSLEVQVTIHSGIRLAMKHINLISLEVRAMILPLVPSMMIVLIIMSFTSTEDQAEMCTTASTGKITSISFIQTVDLRANAVQIVQSRTSTFMATSSMMMKTAIRTSSVMTMKSTLAQLSEAEMKYTSV